MYAWLYFRWQAVLSVVCTRLTYLHRAFASGEQRLTYMIAKKGFSSPHPKLYTSAQRTLITPSIFFLPATQTVNLAPLSIY